MAIVNLGPQQAVALRRADLTYSRADIDPVSDAFRVLRRDRILTSDFDGASQDLMRWRVHAAAGLRVAASAPEVRTGEVVVLTLGIGRIGLRAPCRVVAVIDEPDRHGFVYGTLPGHPECGEESFVMQRRVDGSVVFSIQAVSRPAGMLARLGGPLTERVQLAMVERYLRAAG